MSRSTLVKKLCGRQSVSVKSGAELQRARTKEKMAILMAVLAAALYALNAPVSKLLLSQVPSAIMAGLLYLGAGCGLLLVRLVQKGIGAALNEKRLTKKDAPYTVGIVLLDIAAPICLMIGLTMTNAASVSLLNNFEIVATSMIALFVFREKVSKRLWAAIALVTLASIVLTVKDTSSLQFSFGSIFVLLACVCWGLENNCTRMISHKNPLEIVVIKGFGSGIGALLIAFAVGERLPAAAPILGTLLLGFLAYGLSIFFYIYAQRTLGAAKTSAYYAIAPFIGAALSLAIFKELPGLSFIVALLIMGAGTYLASTD